MRAQLRLSACAAALLAMLAGDFAARADHLLVFKDGFILQGNRVRQGGSINPDTGTGQLVWIPSGNFVLDTGASRVFFSPAPRQLVDFMENPNASEGTLVTLSSPLRRFHGIPIYPLTHIMGATNFDERWERTLTIDADVGLETTRKIKVHQRLGLLTPQYARVDARDYIWSAYYNTKEMGPALVRELMQSHPDTKPKSGDPAPRWRAYRFLTQAGWYGDAEQELADIARQYSGEQGKVEEARQDLRRLRVQRLYDEIQLGHQAGRHRWVQQQLTAFPRAGVEDKLAAGIRSLKGEYAAAGDRLEAARRLLEDLPPHLLPGPRRVLAPAAAAILDELTYENLDRLEPFLTFAQQAERAQKAGATPTHDYAQLLALAATGWLLGKESAEAKVETVRRLWEARAFVLKYQQTAEGSDRAKLLADYRRADPLSVDELAQVIAHLPPPQPDKPTGEVMSLQADVPGGRRKQAKYLVKLPPEYHPGRPSPAVVALHHGGERPQAMIDRLAEEAGRHGYLLAAPEWEQAIEGAYRYTPEEHAAVLETVRDLRRRFAVDSDRVFLLGAGEGGTMAYDVGLSHPDWFAGVVPVSGQPKMFAERYLPNAQLLPFYVVDGDKSGDLTKQNRLEMAKWVPLGYPALYITYKGRGVEWFSAEVPTIFDWMDHKRDRYKRSNGVPEMGTGGGSVHQEFQTMRQTDNRFYWMSTDAINERNVADPHEWRARVFAATLQGSVREGNVIVANVRSLQQLTVWLSRDMIDFSKPVHVRVNNRIVWGGRRVQPSMETMLEDFYDRGDRQRLYLAKIEFDRP